MNKTCMGVDVSTKTGVAIVSWNGARASLITAEVITSKLKGFERLRDVGEKFLVFMLKHQPEFVVFEGYGFANKNSLVTLVEVGTVLRYFTFQEEYKYLDVSPNSLKKFVTGTGNAPKSVMIKEVYRRWGHNVSSDDEADAIGLGYFGLALLGVDLGLPKVNMEAVKPYIPN